MNQKQKIINVLAGIEVVALLAASVAVLIFRFLPYYECLTTAFIGYVIGFFATALRNLLLCIDMFKNENSAEPLDNNKNAPADKSAKRKAVIKTVLWFVMWAFALVVLILYPSPL